LAWRGWMWVSVVRRMASRRAVDGCEMVRQERRGIPDWKSKLDSCASEILEISLRVVEPKIPALCDF
jgi:hypothetical protein